MAQDLAIGLIAPGRYEEAVEMLEQAVVSARDADAELARRLEAELLCAARLDPRTLPVARAAYARAPRHLAGDTPGGRMLLAVLGHERVMRGGTAAEVAAMAARALDGGLLEEQTGDSGLVMDAGFACVVAGDFTRAERGWDAAIAEVRRRGSVIGYARCSCMRAILRLRQGRPAEAEADARAAVEAGWDAGYRVARMAHGPLVEALVDQGQLGAADRALASAGLDAEIADTFMLNFVLLARGRLRAAQARDAEAAADLEELGRREEKWRGRNPEAMPWRSLLAEVPGIDPNRAAALAREELALAEAWGTAGAHGRALRVLGLVTSDEASLRRSVDVLRGSSWRLEEARSLVALGAAARRAGRRREAREPLHAGMELAHRCGAGGLVAQARHELLATGARPRKVVRTGMDALTASELRVARMAAEGRSNRDIAQALFVTVRTVEIHLTHSFAKLGAEGRGDLTRALGSPADHN
jgi:DNA-binding CsgD family transcriptional regulator/tetratricopeptide (TPR) repeat protein